MPHVSINISEYSNKYDEDFDMEFLRRISEICDLKIDYCDNEIFSSNYEEWKALLYIFICSETGTKKA